MNATPSYYLIYLAPAIQRRLALHLAGVRIAALEAAAAALAEELNLYARPRQPWWRRAWRRMTRKLKAES